MEVAGQQDVCRVCTRQYARYTCPRCRLRYCSKECYQQHSQQCTESFSRENAVAELRSTAASDEERRRMQEILHRVHDSDAGADMAEALGMDSVDLQGTYASSGDGGGGDGSGSDEDAVDDTVPLSAATLERLLAAARGNGDPGLDAALQQLDAQELQAFERFVASGQAGQLVERWQPWWYLPAAGEIHLTAHGTWPVKPLADADTPAEELAQRGEQQASAGAAGSSSLPEPPSERVPPLRTATGRPTSPLVRWRLLEALYAYALVLRLYNGEWLTDAAGAAALLLGAAPFLGAQTAAEPVGSGAEAVLQAVTQATGPSGPVAGDRKAANLILGDVAALAALGRAPVLCALADAHRLICAAAAAVAPQQQHQHQPTAAAAADPPAGSSSAPRQYAIVQRPVRRPSGGRRPGESHSTGGHDRGGGRARSVDKQLRRQLRLAGLHVSSFLLPWANEQPPGVFMDVAQAAADGWQRWRDSTQPVRETGNVPASAARISSAGLHSTEPPQRGPARIVAVSDEGKEGHQLDWLDAEAATASGNGTAAGEPMPMPSRLASQLTSISLQADSAQQPQHRPHAPMIEEL